MTPEELAAHDTVSAIKENTDKTDAVLQSVNQLTDVVRNDEGTRKLEEIKSANLINNRLLKDMKPDMKAAGDMASFVQGFLNSIKGEKGDPSDVPGPRGEMGPQGLQGAPGRDGHDGMIGPMGPVGPRGGIGIQGPPGEAGNDGSPDTPDQVIEKVNQSDKNIDAERVRGLVKLIRDVELVGSNPTGQTVGGGGPTLLIQDEGVTVSQFVRALNFIGAGVAVTYSGSGVLAVTINGGSGNFADSETPSGTINGVNATFTLAQTPSPAASLSLYLNGQLLTAGGVDYTLSTATITMITAKIPVSQDILRAWYRY